MKYKTGDTVRILINEVGYRKGIIIREALNAYWILYENKEYFISRKYLDRWNKR